MPFKDKIWEKPAAQGETAQIALAISIALDSIRDALRNISANKDITSQIADINKQSKKLYDAFVELTGYEPDGR